MRLTGGGGKLINQVDVKAYLYESFEGDIDNSIDSSGFILNKELNQVIFTTILNPKWTYTATYFKQEHGVLKIYDYAGTTRSCYCRASKDFGTWEFKIKVINIITDHELRLCFLYQNSANCYFIAVRTWQDIRITKFESGGNVDVLIPNSNLDIGTWYILKITRDVNGNFELFINDVSQGTFQDDFLPEQQILMLQNLQSKTIWVDWVKVT